DHDRGRAAGRSADTVDRLAVDLRRRGAARAGAAARPDDGCGQRGAARGRERAQSGRVSRPRAGDPGGGREAVPGHDQGDRVALRRGALLAELCYMILSDPPPGRSRSESSRRDPDPPRWRLDPGSPARESQTISAPRETRASHGRGQAKRRPGRWYPKQHLQASGVETVKYLIVIEKTRTGFSAYSPDLAGCIATSRTRPSVEKAMRKAIEFHLEGLRAEGRRVRAPKSYSAYVEISARS